MTALPSNPEHQIPAGRPVRTGPNDSGGVSPDIAELLTAAGIGFEVLHDGTSASCPSHRLADDRAA